MLRDISMNEAIFKDIGKNIVFHRKLNGMNQIDLAKRLNMGGAKLSRIERGIDVINVPLSVYIRIAESLNVFVTDLLKSTDVRVKNICVRKSVK
jgi:transcriptional regulator with XRE-family HTH domain